MMDPKIEVKLSDGQAQGVIGAGSVVIENFTIYNRPLEEKSPTGPELVLPCPYPGLEYFGPDNTNQFFGRDAAIFRLAEAVSRQSLTALIGASGSGKSSVVLAGLAPYLHRVGDWRFSHFRIGTELERNPFLAMARALVQLNVASDSDPERLKNTKQLAMSLQAGEVTLRDVFADCRNRNKGRRILLIADQFEEVFTLVEDEAARHHFIDVLLAGFPDSSPGRIPDICLILTLRADFYGQALRHRPFADALQGRVENLGPMNREELQAAIVCPAKGREVSFDPGLVKTLLDEVESKPGSLPLLQFALKEMWERQENRKITLKSYDDIGGVEGALAQRAGAIFAELTRNGADNQMEKNFRHLFTQLVRLGEGQEDTRRVVKRQELDDGAWSLAQKLAGEKNRLIVTNAPTVSRETAEVAHEALIRHWPTLVDWINRDRAFLLWRGQIKSSVELWSADPNDEGTLLRSGMLVQAKDWLAKRRDDLNPEEFRYIDASVAAWEMVQRKASRAVIRTRVAAVVLLILFVATSFLAFGLVGALSEAVERTRESARQTARAQAALARTENDSARYFEAARAALAGLTVSLTVDEDPAQIEPWAELVRTTAADRFLVPPLQHQGAVLTAEFDRKGEHVVTASDDQTARIWDARTGAPIGKPLQHQDRVWDAVFDPAGERVVTASEDQTARIWDAHTGEPIGKPLHHHDGVVTAAFDPTGERVVTASGDRTAQIWDAQTGEPIGKPLQHQGGVNTAAFDPTGQRVVTASDDRTAHIWDARTSKPIGKPLQHQDRVIAAAFDPTGERVITASVDRTAVIWDARTGEPIGKPLQHQGGVNTAAFDPMGQRVVTTSGDKTARIWDARTGEPVGKPLQHQGGVFAAVFDPSGERVVTASDDSIARIWDARTGEPLGEPLQHQDGVVAAVFDPKGERIVTVSLDKTARIWDARTHMLIGKPLQHHDGVVTAAFDPTGQWVVTASRTARIWDARTGEPFGKPLQHQDRVNTAAFDPRGQFVVTASDDTTARIWDAQSGEPIGEPLQHQGRVYTAVFDPKGKRVVTASADNTARIWDARTGAPIGKPLQHQDWVYSAAFAPKGERVVTVSSNTARIWDARTGAPIGKPLQHQERVWDAVFDPAGERVVTASEDHTARIWDAHTGEPIGKPLQHQDRVFTAAFDPAGERVVTASEDNTARVWDAHTGEPIGKPLQHQDRVFTAAFDPAGERVVTASFDKTARIWTAPPTGDILLNRVRSTLGRNAPQPLNVQSTTARRQGWREYVDTMWKGLVIIWTWGRTTDGLP